MGVQIAQHGPQPCRSRDIFQHVQTVGRLADSRERADRGSGNRADRHAMTMKRPEHRSEEHTSELQSLMRTSYAVFCLKKKIQPSQITRIKVDLQPHTLRRHYK